jgi:hypothetical protein
MKIPEEKKKENRPEDSQKSYYQLLESDEREFAELMYQENKGEFGLEEVYRYVYDIKLNGETVENKKLLDNVFSLKAARVSRNHIIPFKNLIDQDKKTYRPENMIIGDANQNSRLQDHIDPLVEKDPNSGKYRFNGHTMEAIKNFGIAKNSDKLNSKFCTEIFNGVQYLLTSHTIDGLDSFKVPVDSLIDEHRNMVIKHKHV